MRFIYDDSSNNDVCERLFISQCPTLQVTLAIKRKQSIVCVRRRKDNVCPILMLLIILYFENNTRRCSRVRVWVYEHVSILACVCVCV